MDEEGRHQRFTSSILPPYTRRSPKVAEVLPILYLRGLPTGDFRSSSPYPVSSSPLKSGRVAPRSSTIGIHDAPADFEDGERSPPLSSPPFVVARGDRRRVH